MNRLRILCLRRLLNNCPRGDVGGLGQSIYKAGSSAIITLIYHRNRFSADNRTDWYRYCPSCMMGETKPSSSRPVKPKLREDLHIPPLIARRTLPKQPYATHQPSPLSLPDGARPQRKAAINQPDYHALHHSISTPTAKWLDLIADPGKTGRTINESEL